MEPTHELTLDESLELIVPKLPAPIRAYFAQDKINPIIRQLTQKYQLHLDQGGILGRGIIMLLLGVQEPAEFAKDLAEGAKLDTKTTDAILADINTQIFIPLHEEMRTQGSPANSTPPPLPIQLKPAASAPMVPSAPQSPIPTMSTPLANKVLNRLEVLPENLPGVVLPKAPPKPAVPSQLSGALRNAGIQLLSDHEVAHMDLKKPATPAAYPMQPLRPQTPIAPAPRPIPPPIAPQPAPIKPAAPTPMPSLPNYTIDPYREMPDEHEK